jgi:hypothetical protein
MSKKEYTKTTECYVQHGDGESIQISPIEKQKQSQSTSHLLFSNNLRVVLVNWNLLRCCEAYLSPRGAHKDTTTSRHELCQMGFQIWRACGVDIPGALLPFAKLSKSAQLSLSLYRNKNPLFRSNKKPLIDG